MPGSSSMTSARRSLMPVTAAVEATSAPTTHNLLHGPDFRHSLIRAFVLQHAAAVTITCADCGEMQTVPELPPGGTAECHRCDRLLGRRRFKSLDVSLA